MDILYIVGNNCSQCDNFELRMSLRSIEKYGKGIGRVFVAGDCPNFLSNEVIKVPFTQPYIIEEQENDLNIVEKHINILSTLLYAVDNTDISEEFLISMDDHIYVRDVDFSNYPFYVKEFGKDNLLPKTGDSVYRKFLVATRKQCDEHKISAYYTIPHRNMHLNKETISECRPFLNEIIEKKIPCEPLAYLINYRLTNKKDFKLTPVKDVKLCNGAVEWWKTDSRYTEVFSTPNFTKGSGLYTLICGLYKNKSKYEK